MKKIILMASLTVSMSLLIASSTAQAGMYRWVDEAGEVHFSDKVPVAATKKAVSQMDKNGVIRNTVDPEADALAKKLLEETAAERQKLALLEKIEEDKLANLRKRDNYLLSTYEDQQEIIASFENKIKLMKGNAAILDAQSSVLEKKLVKLLTRKSTAANDVQKESIETKIVNINDTITQYKKALKQNKSERISLSSTYKTDLKRFSELTK